MTADTALRENLLRLAAAACSDVIVVTEPDGARSYWSSAPLVLVGADLAAACARAGLPPRSSLVMVVPEQTADTPWSDAEALRAEHVALLPLAEPWLVDRLAEQDGHGSGHRGLVVAVLGGRGGAGASVFAAGLAVTGLRRGLATLLVDADPLGGGVDLVLGWEAVDGIRWPDLTDARGRINPPALVEALPGQGNLSALSFGRGDSGTVPVDAMAAALDAGRRGRDLIVADLPRQFDDAARLVLATADRGYLIVPAELRACAAAAQVAAGARAHCPAMSVVVRGPAPGGLDADLVARSLDLPLAGTLRPEPGLAPAMERGEAPAASGRGPLARLCRELLADLAPGRNAETAG